MQYSLKIYAICAVILFFKMQAVGISQVMARTKHKTFLIPEDAKNFAQTEAVDKEHPDVIRANKAYMNDLENIPIFLFLALTYVILNCPDKLALIYFPVFTFARIMHTAFYLKGNQPLRSMGYGIGFLINIILSGHIIYKVMMA